MDLFSDDIALEDLETATRLLRESRTGFLKLFNSSPVCMSMTTTNLGKRVYVRVNRMFVEKFGFDESEIIGRTSPEIGILDAEESLRVGAMIKEKGRLHNDYVKCIAKSGKIVHTISSIEMMEMNGETYLVSFFVDITKVMEQQVIIEQHAQELETVNRDLEAFSYSVSHDLRAPLRAINGYAKMLEEDFDSVLDDEGKRILAAVQSNAKKMGNLIDDLLAFAKLGRMQVRKTPVDLDALAGEILSELKKTTGHKAEIRTGKLPPVMGDLSLIRQVLVNLISNAVKYSSIKEKPVVEITAETKDGMVTCTVKDNGAGFDMKYADRLFGVFQRLHSEEEFEGTGVGLAIVQRIVSRHGGTVHAEGEPGKGATFRFSLPAAV
ncbi:MAG TPA: ATP-binding protein [Bacteroidia bacterium]|nr:ATP-binding protein [Bacteroidia bacterium]